MSSSSQDYQSNISETSSVIFEDQLDCGFIEDDISSLLLIGNFSNSSIMRDDENLPQEGDGQQNDRLMQLERNFLRVDQN